MNSKKRVTGIGGIFFKCKNTDETKSWYERHLGIKMDEYGGIFEFRKSDNPDEKGYTVWSPFKADTKYFEPSEKEYMVNYRVENIEWLVEELKKEGVTVVDEIEVYEYGKFVHILDTEGNKIELWEPVDSVFEKMYDGKATF